MAERAKHIYRRLGGRRWLRWQSDDAWLAADHLLCVRTRFFTERYTRLYWYDIQALQLYRLPHNSGLMLAAEIACILAAVTAAFFQRRFEVTAVAFCYVVIYAVWRLTRRNYGVEILTRTAAVRVPMAMFQRSARRTVDQLRQQVESVQGQLPLALEVPDVVTEPAADPMSAESEDTKLSAVAVTIAGGKRPHRPTLVLHGIVFGIGLTTWLFVSGSLLSDAYWIALGGMVAVLFYAGLLAACLVQQDSEFPFAVRSAVVMNLALQAATVGPLLALGARLSIPSVNAAMLTLGPPMTLLRLLACLFGLIGIYRVSLDEADKPLTQPRTGSNSLA